MKPFRYPLFSNRKTRVHSRLVAVSLLLFATQWLAASPRQEIPLLEGWRSTVNDDSATTVPGFAQPDFDDGAWKAVDVPHNWDGYEGFRQVKHGDRHGVAWYRREFTVPTEAAERAVFLYFEGVSSYAEVFVNGQSVGSHAGGLTTFTLEITNAVRCGETNTLALRVGHPAGIRDLPWVCGGCELAYGFSEGTQPFGINRPVTLVITDPLRIAPFGVHAWNDADLTHLSLETEVVNNGTTNRAFTLRQRLVDADDRVIAEVSQVVELAAGATASWKQDFRDLASPHLWSPADPYLHTIETDLLVNGTVIDHLSTPYGLRFIEWPDLDAPPGEPLRINGEPFFVNGVADYEHMLGQSHAFTAQQVEARAEQIMAAGFNAFRDAHHPHNLRFNAIWDRQGLLWWTQFGAHIWFENETFQENYLRLLRDWVKERRNSPSLFLYGLQNESKLPTWFAEQCAAIIRELDPTASQQRLITTCNGGTGTDWDVPQNWSGTYGGDPERYDEELVTQRMVGEYGAWRSLEFHSEGGFFNDAPLTEDRMAGLLEIKVREAEKVRDQVIGHFMWPFTTHQNPGRNVGSNGEQTRDGIRPLDQIGPANNKGLFTIWGEPTDAFYMYRANFADPATDPMVYIVSHTWPDRWPEPGVKDGLIVYSNCDEVELFNGDRSLGVRTRGATGTHFQWDGVVVDQNLLVAEGRIDGKVVTRDWITLHHLPESPTPEFLRTADAADSSRTDSRESTYLYRVNAGGSALQDGAWLADRDYADGDRWGSRSWGARFPNLDPRFGSQRKIYDPVRGTSLPELYQTFRYGRDELEYVFAVPANGGPYRVELFFTEPWYGLGNIDATSWRVFDVALNGEIVLKDLDIFAETGGRAIALQKDFTIDAPDGQIRLTFPHVEAGQAVISGIAISASDGTPTIDDPAEGELMKIRKDSTAANAKIHAQLDTGDVVFSGPEAPRLVDLAWELRGAEWLEQAIDATEAPLSLEARRDTIVYAAPDPRLNPSPSTLPEGWEPTPHTLTLSLAPETPFPIVRRRLDTGERMELGKDAWWNGPTLVFFQSRRPPPPATGIFDFSVSGSEAKASWQAIGNLRHGETLYSDGGPAIARFHSRLGDCDWIRTADADADNPDIHARFEVRDHTLVYVAFDMQMETPPDWILENGWFPSNGYRLQTTADEDYAFFMWTKRFLPGQVVDLGPNGHLPDGSPARMYSVIVRSVRAAFTLQTEDQVHAAKLLMSELPGYTGNGYADLAKLPEDVDTFTLGFEVGVGDRYGLNIRYHSSSDELIELAVTIRNDADGSVVCDDTYVFEPTGGAGWSILRERTCESTNAGQFSVELSGLELRQLAIDSMQVE